MNASQNQRKSMIQPERIEQLNSKRLQNGRYILYWLQAAQRCEYNHALEYAIEQANQANLPVVVLFCLVDNYPEANLRHTHFMLQGLQGFVVASCIPDLSSACTAVDPIRITNDKQ